MSAPKKPGSRPQRSGKQSGKSKGAHPNKKKPTVTELPDLDPILDSFTDAYAVVRSASYALRQSEDDEDEGFALSALRQGVTALGAVLERLDEVGMQLHPFRERAGGAS